VTLHGFGLAALRRDLLGDALRRSQVAIEHGHPRAFAREAPARGAAYPAAAARHHRHLALQSFHRVLLCPRHRTTCGHILDAMAPARKIAPLRTNPEKNQWKIAQKRERNWPTGFSSGCTNAPTCC